MAFETFTPPIDPSPGIGRRVKYNVFEAEFGDGYSQTVGNGINFRRRQMTLAWDVLTDDQADEIAEFFFPRAKTTPFYWQPPRESEPVKWICDEWTDDVTQDGLRKITATFIQSFLND